MVLEMTFYRNHTLNSPSSTTEMSHLPNELCSLKLESSRENATEFYQQYFIREKTIKWDHFIHRDAMKEGKNHRGVKYPITERRENVNKAMYMRDTGRAIIANFLSCQPPKSRLKYSRNTIPYDFESATKVYSRTPFRFS